MGGKFEPTREPLTVERKRRSWFGRKWCTPKRTPRKQAFGSLRSRLCKATASTTALSTRPHALCPRRAGALYRLVCIWPDAARHHSTSCFLAPVCVCASLLAGDLGEGVWSGASDDGTCATPPAAPRHQRASESGGPLAIAFAAADIANSNSPAHPQRAAEGQSRWRSPPPVRPQSLAAAHTLRTSANALARGFGVPHRSSVSISKQSIGSPLLRVAYSPVGRFRVCGGALIR